MNFFQDLQIDWLKAKQEYSLEMNDFRGENFSKYLYRDQLHQFLNWIESAQFANLEANKIYSIVGDRGSGKSSFLKTLNNAICSGYFGQETTDYRKSKPYVLTKIDPILFDRELSVMELFTSMLNQEFETYKTEMNFDNTDYQRVTDFKYELRNVIEVLKDISKGKKHFSDKDSGIEVLLEIQNRQAFQKTISRLIENFLTVMSLKDPDTNYSNLIVQIDDLDLVQNENVYETLNDIFKFLGNQKRIIVVIAYREEQLMNSVIDNLIKDNMLLIKKDVIDTFELKEQAARFLEKGLPKSNRVYLEITEETSIEQILFPYLDPANNRLDDYLEEIKKSDFTSKYSSSVPISDVIRYQVMLDTRLTIDPVDKFEQTSLTYPKTIRSTLQYLEKLWSLESYQKNLMTIDSRDDNEFENIISLLKRNIRSFQSFMMSKFSEELKFEDFEVVNQWLRRSCESKNGFLVVVLANRIEGRQKPDINNQRNEEDKVKIERLKQISSRQTYNISLGDVFEVLEAYKDAFRSREQDLYFVYAIKVIYSSEILSEFLDCIKHQLRDKDTQHVTFFENVGYWKDTLHNYTSLVHGKIIMDNYYYADEFLSNEFRLILPYREDYLTYQYIICNGIARNGEVFKAIDKSKGFTEKYSGLQYRYLYEKYQHGVTPETSFIKDISYGVDPFAYLTDENYLSSLIIEILSNETQKPHYFFYSMFDLDFFVRKNYTAQSRGKQSVRFGYLLDRINDIFSKKLRTEEEKEFSKKMPLPLMCKDTVKATSYCEPFTQELKNELTNWVENEENKEYLTKDEAREFIKETLDQSPKIMNEVSFDGYEQDRLKRFANGEKVVYNIQLKNLVNTLRNHVSDKADDSDE